MLIDQLFDAVKAKRNPTVMGLDTRFEYLPEAMQQRLDPATPFESAAALIGEFNTALMEACVDIVPAVKLQSAYYEMYGLPGIRMMVELMETAKKLGYVVILDGKRNDIGATAQAYSSAYLGKTPLGSAGAQPCFDADFLTVTPYLGEDGLLPFVEDCVAHDKGIFVLAKTSNPSSGQLQDLMVEGKPLYWHMMALIDGFDGVATGKYGYRNVGAVVGATYPEQGAALREAFPAIPFLVPGYGAQGAKGSDLALCFDERGLGALVNASRSLLCAHQKSDKSFAQATRDAALAMQADLLGALEQAHRLEY